jgi:radical SAM superfamily enzyme YgiQ (UPF0313 family)
LLFHPIKYDEPLFRPPSEAFSLILQVTIGCSWNKCAFCEMYTSKKFRVRSEEDVLKDINAARQWNPDLRKVFLADGNAMVLSSGRLMAVLFPLNDRFSKLSRISAYSLPKDLENKSVKELTELKNAGLTLIYVGIETGDDEILKLINKGETFESTINNLSKAKEAGIKISVMILNGLGGKKYSVQHALNSAKIINAIQPEFLSTLVLSFPFGMDHYKTRFKGTFEALDRSGLLKEIYLFISELRLENAVFRSDHASNYLILKGNLSRDRERILSQIETAIQNPEVTNFREEWQRGL